MLMIPVLRVITNLKMKSLVISAP